MEAVRFFEHLFVMPLLFSQGLLDRLMLGDLQTQREIAASQINGALAHHDEFPQVGRHPLRIMMRFFDGGDGDRKENARLLDEAGPLPNRAVRQQFGDQRLFMNFGQIQGLQLCGERFAAQFSCRPQICWLAWL